LLPKSPSRLKTATPKATPTITPTKISTTIPPPEPKLKRSSSSGPVLQQSTRSPSDGTKNPEISLSNKERFEQQQLRQAEIPGNRKQQNKSSDDKLSKEKHSKRMRAAGDYSEYANLQQFATVDITSQQYRNPGRSKLRKSRSVSSIKLDTLSSCVEDDTCSQNERNLMLVSANDEEDGNSFQNRLIRTPNRNIPRHNHAEQNSRQILPGLYLNDLNNKTTVKSPRDVKYVANLSPRKPLTVQTSTPKDSPRKFGNTSPTILPETPFDFPKKINSAKAIPLNLLLPAQTVQENTEKEKEKTEKEKEKEFIRQNIPDRKPPEPSDLQKKNSVKLREGSSRVPSLGKKDPPENIPPNNLLFDHYDEKFPPPTIKFMKEVTTEKRDEKNNLEPKKKKEEELNNSTTLQPNREHLRRSAITKSVT